jgi:hypothetical protein
MNYYASHMVTATEVCLQSRRSAAPQRLPHIHIHPKTAMQARLKSHNERHPHHSCS